MSLIALPARVVASTQRIAIVDLHAITPFGFASVLNRTLNGFEVGKLSELETRRRLKRLGFTPKVRDDVIAARRKRAERNAP